MTKSSDWTFRVLCTAMDPYRWVVRRTNDTRKKCCWRSFRA